MVAKIIKSASVFRALCDGGWSLFQNPRSQNEHQRFQNDDLEKGWKLGRGGRGGGGGGGAAAAAAGGWGRAGESMEN